MENISVTTASTLVLAAGNRFGASLLLQNQSDTTMWLAVGEENVAVLTAALGLQLEPGDSLTLDGPTACRPIYAIHGGVGSKVLHSQLA